MAARRNALPLLIIASIIVVILFVTLNTSVSPRPESNYKIYNLTEDGTILWYNQPSTVHFEGNYSRTYFSWLNSKKEVVISYYDHDNEEFSEGRSVYEWKKLDDHGSPVPHIIQNETNKGTILIFMALHNSPLLALRSSHSEDIADWKNPAVIDDGKCTYPSVVETRDGRLIIFYRKFIPEMNKGVLAFRMSSDQGLNWSAEKSLVDFGANTTIYFAPIDAAGGDNISVTWSVSNKETSELSDVFFVSSSDGGLTWRSGNKEQTLPVDSTKCELVYRSRSNRSTRAWDVKVDSGGNPIITFVDYSPQPNSDAISSDSTKCWPPETYFAAKKVDWSITKVCDCGVTYYPSGAVIDENAEYRVYVSVPDSNGRFEIEEYESADEGTSWQNTRHITGGSAVNQVRPQIISGNSGLKLIWIEERDYPSLNDFTTSLKVSIDEVDWP